MDTALGAEVTVTVAVVVPPASGAVVSVAPAVVVTVVLEGAAVVCSAAAVVTLAWKATNAGALTVCRALTIAFGSSVAANVAVWVL